MKHLLLSLCTSPWFLFMFCILILYQDTGGRNVLFHISRCCSPPALCSVLSLHMQSHFQLPGSRKTWSFWSVNTFMGKIAQQTDEPLSGLRQFLFSPPGADVCAHLGLVFGWIQGLKVIFLWSLLLPTPWLLPSLCAVEKSAAVSWEVDLGLFCCCWRRGGGRAGQGHCCALEDSSRLSSSLLLPCCCWGRF